MTYQEILEQISNFTVEQKQKLAYYLLFSIISEEKRNEFISLFQYSSSFEKWKNNNLLNTFSSWRNKLPEDLVFSEDEFYN